MNPQLGQVDSNLQTIRAIEGAWSLPSLPDEVKLDLVAQASMDPDQLAEFLYGIDNDVQETQRREPLPAPEPLSPFSFVPTPAQQAAQLTYGLMGQNAPRDLDSNAVSMWKQRAIDQGYLDGQRHNPADPRWLPEYNAIAREMNIDQMTREFSGDRPGSLSATEILTTIGEWVSPASLYRTAINLDLWWDVEAIQSEADNWANKWKEFATNPGPRKLIDALTGPLDDAILPVLNWGLMFVGVGEVIAIGRGLQWGARAAKFAPNALRGLIPGRTLPKILSAGDVAADIARMTAPGQGIPGQLLAHTTRNIDTLGPIGRGLESFRSIPRVESLAKGLDNWRRYNVNVLARKANQQAVRLGFIGKTQEWAGLGGSGQLPGAEGLTAWYDRTITDNVPASIALDLVSVHFLPMTFFQPGAVGALAQSARAGAAKIWFADFLPTGTRRAFERIGAEEQASLALGKAVRRLVEEEEGLGTPAGLAAANLWDREVRKVGLTQAVANKYTNGSIEELGQLHFWSTINAGLEAMTDEITSLGGRATRAGRTRYLQQRSQLNAKISHYDPHDPDAAFEHMALYQVLGDDLGKLDDPATVLSPRGQRAAIEEVQERYRESAELVMARGGAVPDGSVRLFRQVDPENFEQHTWSTTPTDDIDPEYIDLDIAEAAERHGMTPDEMAARLALGTDGLDLDVFAARHWVSEDGVLRRTRLSDAVNYRRYDPEKLGRLRTVIQGHNVQRQAFLRELLDRTVHKNPALLEEFYYKTLPTMGGMADFIRASHLIDNAQLLGRLDNVTYRTPLSPSGRRISNVPWSKGGLTDGPWGKEMTNIFYDLADSDDLAQWLSTGMFAPLARDMNPTRSGFTIGRHDPTKVLSDGKTLDPAYSTVFKDEALEFAAQAQYRLRVLKAIEKLKATSPARFDEAIQRYLDKAGQLFPSEVTIRRFVNEVAEDMMMADGNRTNLARVVLYAQANGVDLTRVQDAVLQDIARINDDIAWTERYGLAGLDRPSDAVKSLQQKVKELQDESFFMAARVDNVPPQLAAQLAADNKVLVHGVDFVQPKDLLHNVPEMAEATAAQLRQLSIGNFFRRKVPQELGQLRTRQFRSSLWAEVARSQRAGKEIRFNLGKFGESADLKKIERDLRELLEEAKQSQNLRRDMAGVEGRIARTANNVTGGLTPHTISDLAGPFYGRSRFVTNMKARGYSTDEINAIWKAVHGSRALGFQTEGLAAVESYLRSKPLATDALRLFGRHVANDNFNPTQKALTSAFATGLLPRGAAAAVGYQVGSQQYMEVSDEEFGLGAFAAGVTGGLAGRMGLHALGRKLNLAIEAPARIGKLSHHFEGIRAATVAAKWDSSKWAQYAYLADNLAGLRDYARFALSPIFDASRYSEAIVLSQLADLPEGMRNLAVNQSPSSYRAGLRRAHRKAGVAPDVAKEMADTQWKQNRTAFIAASRGDFDYEALESLAGWTDQAGILGFSPAEWMVSTFSHLRDANVPASDAYRIAREIYSYGIKGRSAAELSMNFVFFPFSFTKKSLGHVRDFLSKDVGRSILMHDMLKSYELLNEHYNLNEFFEERMPILNKMQRLNLFAYGVNLGEFGGINAPFLRALGETPPGQVLSQKFNPVDPILSMFVPQVVEIRNADEANEMRELIQRLLPVINDMGALIDDLGQQGRVVFSESHLTSRAEVDRAYEEWRGFQKAWTEGLAAAGVTWNDAMRGGERWEPFQQMVREVRVDISSRYPNWKLAMGDGIAEGTALDMELAERLANPTKRGGDAELAEFHAVVSIVEDMMGQQGYNWNEPEFIPPAIFTGLRAEALKLAQRNPRFLGLYNRFYRRLMGEISYEMVSQPAPAAGNQ